ncbi:MAG TPA: FecR domain-containing protein [Chryseolinea sp.]|nr:FecR domain-containing protein [Chryseolinea sp.]
MDKDRIAYLIKKLRKQQATPEEKKELEAFWQWAQHDQSLFAGVPEVEKQSIKRDIWEGLRAKIEQLETLRPKGKRRVMHTGVLWKVAASLTLLATVAFLWLMINKDVTEVHTGYGEHVSVLLPDSSTVILNGNSTLRYGNSWNAFNDREVSVEGEAFFEVKHTVNNQRFVVHTGDELDVEVLGTRFNVKVRRGKPEVMLEQGKVRLAAVEEQSFGSAILRPGEMATLEGSTLRTTTVNPHEYASWKEHKLFFEETPLGEVANLLEDTYGIDVVFESKSLLNRRLSGEIQSEKVGDVLAAIAESFNISVTKDSRKVTFHESVNQK